jgi:hypothetical protein
MKELLFAVIYLISLYLSGLFVSNCIKIFLTRWSYISVGFVGQLAVIELLGWWMVAFRQSVYLFIVLVVGVVLIGTVGGICVAGKSVSKMKYESTETCWEKAVLLVVMFALCVLMYLFYRSDADDSFYVSNVLLFSKSDTLNLYDSSMGNPSLGTVPMYDFQIWESYLAVFCRLFSIKASVMCHFVMVPILFFVSVSAYLLLGDVLFEVRRKSALFATGLLVLYSMGGYAVYSKGSFLLSRVWQGKAVYLHVVLPIVIALMLFYLQNKRTSQGLLLALVMLAGIALNPTSMYVIGFQILFMMLTIICCERHWKGLIHVVPTLLVIGLFSILILLRTHNYSGQIEAASSVPENFAYNTFVSFMGEGKAYFLIYIIFSVFVLLRGDVKGKILCVYTPILLFVGVWNPLVAPLVAKHLTMVPSYWRLFWLLPVDFTIGYCLVYMTNMVKHVCWRRIIFAGMIIVMIFPGKFMFTQNNSFIRAENEERIPSEVLFLGKEIIADAERKQVVLANEMSATTLRQELDDIELVYSRYQYILDLIMYRDKQEEAAERIALMEFVNGTNSTLDYSYVAGLLFQYKVDWILIDDSQETSIRFLEDIGYQKRSEKNGLLLLHDEN